MATTRFGHLDDFTLKNSKVGIGTSDPTEALEVIGGSRSKDIKVTGIATLTSYEGFLNKKTSYNTENIDIAGGESGTLSGEIVIGAGLTMSVGTGATTGQGSIKSLKVSNTFTPPIGGTNDRPTAPQPGALYYNKDFRTIEYWDGNFWRQVDNTTRSGRQLNFGGKDTGGNRESDIHYIQISTLGNSQSFGNLTGIRRQVSACGSAIRALTMGGSGPGGDTNEIYYYTFASEGNGADFGNLQGAKQTCCCVSSSTRGISYGSGGSPYNQIDYVEISTLGDAQDFGDMATAKRLGAPASSPTRGFAISGYDDSNIIIKKEYITIASKGNGTNFGDVYAGSLAAYGTANTTRAIIAGGAGHHYNSPYPRTKRIEYFEMASLGESISFGELARLTSNGGATGSCSNSTRGLFTGGYVDGSNETNNIDYVTFSSTGNAVDFGDLTSEAYAQIGTASDSHGGLGGF